MLWVPTALIVAGMLILWFVVNEPYFQGFDDTANVAAFTFNENASVIIAGAWRHPPRFRRGRGELSKAFKLRVRRGVEVAARYGIRNIVFTGALWDSLDARRWALEEFSTMMRSRHNRTALRSPEPLTASLAINVVDDDSDSADGERTATVVAPDVRLHVENKSTTTATNAAEAAALLDAQLPGGAVVVVSSAYHLPRCRLYFRKYMKQRQVFTVPADADEFELVMPTEWWIAVRFSAKAPAPSSPLAEGPQHPANNESTGNETVINVTSNGSDNSTTGAERPRNNSGTETVNNVTGVTGNVSGNASAASSPGAADDDGAAEDDDDEDKVLYSVRFHPIAKLFPTGIISLAHSIAVTCLHWLAHLRGTLWSVSYFARAREAVAFVVNFWQGRFTLADVDAMW
jgi:hypothetical protein